jgi:nucleoside-diphosphate-sugar epimerase
MRILVIGGTRFIGRAAVAQLHAAGHTLAVLNRGQTPADLPDGVTRFTGDASALADSRADIAAFAPDVVLHTIVIHAGHARDLMAVCRGIAGRVVLLSSMDVYRAYGRLIGTEPGPPERGPASEDAPLREKRYPYRERFPDESHPLHHYDKIPAEQAVLGDSDLPGTVLRLPMVIGPHDYQHRLYGYIKPMLDGRTALVMGADYARWRSTYGYVENIAHGIALACTDDRAAGRVYNVAHAAFTPLQMGQMVAAALAWSGEFVTVPEADLPDALHPGMDTRHHLVVSSQRIRAELDYAEPVDFDGRRAPHGRMGARQSTRSGPGGGVELRGGG